MTTENMMKMMKTTTLAIATTLAVAGCAERVPSELRPGFTSLTELPFNLCTDEGLGPASLLMRNIGDDLITIDSVAFEAAADAEDELASFDAPELDTDKVLADDEALLQFTYRVPDGVEQNAILVITSDAEVNPRLEVPVSTQERVLDTPPDCD